MSLVEWLVYSNGAGGSPITGLLSHHTTATLAGIVTTPTRPSNTHHTTPQLKILPRPHMATLQLHPHPPPPPYPPPIHVPTPKHYNPYCPPIPHSIIPTIADELGKLFISVTVHCCCRSFFRTYITIHSRPDLLPLTLTLHSSAPLINHQCNHGAPVSTEWTMATVSIRQVLKYGYHVLSHRYVTLVHG